jgi:hypothetical protein
MVRLKLLNGDIIVANSQARAAIRNITKIISPILSALIGSDIAVLMFTF